MRRGLLLPAPVADWKSSSRIQIVTAYSNMVLNDVQKSALSDAEIQTVLQAWQGIALNELRPVIDRQALSMKSAEERSQKARKQLAQLLKNVKQIQQSEQDQTIIHKSFSDMIKSFQKEVDELTKRSAFAENCFHQLYSKLYVAPDPAIAVSMAILYNKEKEKNSLLQLKLSKYESSEFYETQDGEVVTRELEQNFQLMSEGESSRSSNMLQAQIRLFEAERTRLLKESQSRENLLQQELQKCRDLLSKTQTQLDDLQTKLVIIHDRKEKKDSTRDQFSNLITEEMQFVKSELATLKHENATLKSSLQRASDLSTNEALAEANRRSVESQQKLEKLLRDYNQSLQENEVLRQQLDDQIHSKTSLEKRYQVEIHVLQEQIKSLQDTLTLLPSLEEIDSLKKQVKLLQIDTFNSMDAGDATTDLEKVLFSKGQKLESELAKMRIEQMSWYKQLDEARSSLQVSHEQNAHLTTIVEKLESTVADLSRNPVAQSLFNSNPYSSSTNVLSMQRERYRKLIESLEMEKATLLTRNDCLLQQMSTLQQDNENLYLRLQAIQSETNNNQDTESGGAIENKYAKLINEKRNPFRRFARNQNPKSCSELLETMMSRVNSIKICLGNKSFRSVIFLYALALHALVFISLLTHTVIPHCPQNTKH